MNQKNRTGFTIVELLIVIVVIAILATITIMAYNGMLQRSNDTQRKNDLAAIAKALTDYQSNNGTYAGAGSGCGSGGNGNGWYDYTYSPYLSTQDCLTNPRYIDSSINDPLRAKGCTAVSGGQECFRYMKYECGGGTWLYANLESMPYSTTDLDGACNTTLDSLYGMNYALRVD